MCGQNDTPVELVAHGRQRDVVYAIRNNGQMPARDFLDGLQPAHKARFLAYFRHLCNTGRLATNRLKKLETAKGVAWEFRDPKWRIGAFQHGRQWVLTHGFPKRGRKTPRRQIEMIERIREEHLGRSRERGAK